MTRFTHNEERVIRAMHSLSRMATTAEIAKWANNMSWNTADKILHQLGERHIVVCILKGERRFWELNY